jgi:UDP-N-acetylmuramoyl-L-alanyl-D-glutamate--2,6-diaminopimelate ligase
LQVVGYGFGAGCAVLARDLRQHEAGLTFEVTTPWGTAEIRSALPGRFNAYNLLATLSALVLSEVRLPDAVEALQQVEAVPGRMQKLGGGDVPTVIVDYAHTPDALQNVLATLREAGKRALVCVFGCGGDRDRAKRPLMGEIASRLADRVIVTSDNPRNEDPFAIIAEITAAMSGSPQVISDRRAAVEAAVLGAERQDIVLIAGKGHETYQEVRGVKLPFDDAEVAKHALKLWSDRDAAAE